jgi:hypothetical protein
MSLITLAELKEQLLRKSHTHANVVCLWLNYVHAETEAEAHIKIKIINALTAMEHIPDLSWGQIALLSTFFCEPCT